jgi:hypothetical protein
MHAQMERVAMVVLSFAHGLQAGAELLPRQHAMCGDL